MEEEILILKIKFVKSVRMKDGGSSQSDEPNWKKLGLRNPTTGKFEDEDDVNPDQYQVEFDWRNKTFKRKQIKSIEEISDEVSLFVLKKQEDCLVQIGFKEALKLIYNKEDE